ncbi:MAG: 5-methyltetrahydropteroyltriglutamate--homocysteine S-methyltransferase [Rhodospirillales bacterium]|nr:5-methyltetrahydropteroyltriglutamate--homocysteine S-methyltransferase [Rhodospirillaceae bacterium]MDP6427308.1 5-methyltetrahydropteroyltriglutamate--homocysteine S-methyltransferase [Rhodospirillales bacterium]MDP6645088.1 5-methyltetrahydropteroyltriglutamate--homocysteine S-methyltransferase [Rhodospirillales bacterium]MDP6841604.1 5-methyltetrahydropteroyltriglutamate--homocysteine S-methyltransferase [Rhodospirillales bacterium]
MTKGPFRADQVGSFLRPKELMDTREKHRNGEIDLAALREVEDRLIREVVKNQEEAGMTAVTDGDFRRTSWSGDFLTAIEGVEMDGLTSQSASAPPKETPKGEVVRDWQPPTPLTKGKLALPAGGIQRQPFEFLKGATSRTAKVCIPSPSMLHFRGGRGGVDETAYPDMEDFFGDVSAIWRAEIMDLADAGCRYVQLDDTNLAYLCDVRMRERVRGLGEDPDQLPLLYARLINTAIADRPDDMAITVHLCRGNSLSRGHAEGGYEPVAEKMFNEVKVDGFFLEYDSERAGDFKPLRFVPKGLKIVLGIVTSKFGELEDSDDLKRRIDEAAEFMPLDQMCLSPQCGFASHTGGNILEFDQQWAKLSMISELAKDVWADA